MNNPGEAQPPFRNHLFIVLRVEAPRDYISITPLGDVSLDLGHSAAVESS